jgi:hypothetical protein
MNSKLILIFLSITFITLGVLDLINLVNLTSIAYLAYSLAALLFVISDIFDDINEKIIKIKSIDIYQFFIKLLAIVSILVLPYINKIKIIDNIKFSMIPILIGFLFLVMSKDYIINNIGYNIAGNQLDYVDKKSLNDKSLKNNVTDDEIDMHNNIVEEILVKNKLNLNDDKKQKRFTLYDKIDDKK